jgi:enoyl-CoA hydratase/carnithine racemase
MRVELGLLFDETDADDEVKAVIVTGAGRAFCAGADLRRGATPSTAQAPQNHAYLEKLRVGDVYRDGGGTNTLRIYESLKPVIGAINGPAVGIGATIQLPMDMRLASTSARFGFVFARRGITLEAASSMVPAAPGRHADGARVVHDRPRVRRRRGACARAGALACMRPTRCCRRRGRWRGRSPTTRRRCRWR